MTKSATSALKGARVLVLEDEFFLADDLARCLREAGAEPVGPANTVKQAEHLVAGQPPDAAIVDLNVRGEMASDFVQHLTAIRLPCLIVSGYGEDALPQGVSGIPRLEKPINPSAVLERLAVELARAR